MAIRTIAPFLAYEADGGGTGVPLLAKGTPGTVLVAAADTTQTSIVATAYRLSDGAEFVPMANHHGAVEGFRVDIPDNSPGIWFVSGPVASYQPTVEGSRGERGLPGFNGIETDVALGEYLATPGTNANSETKVLVGQVLDVALDARTADILAGDSQASGVLAQQVKDAATPVGAALKQSIDAANAKQLAALPVAPVEHLDRIKVLSVFDYREVDSAWIQAVAINENTNEIYAGLQISGATTYRIEVRDLPTGTLKHYKTFTITSEAYAESLPYFYNAAGDLCFMVRTGAGANEPSYNIFNYSTGTLGPRIPILGVVKAAAQGNHLLTMEHTATNITKFYVYDWASVQAGTPTLLRTISAQSNGQTLTKNQGLVFNGEYIFVLQGGGGTYPGVTVYDLMGNVVKVLSLNKPSYADALNATAPSTVIDRNNYWFEMEGGTTYQGKLVSCNIIANGTTNRAVIVQHNTVDGARVAQDVNALAVKTDWLDCTFDTANGWGSGSGGYMRVKRTGSLIELRSKFVRTGAPITVAAHGNMPDSRLATLPSGVPAPTDMDAGLHSGNAGTLAMGAIWTNGNVMLTAHLGGVTINTGDTICLYGFYTTN